MSGQLTLCRIRYLQTQKLDFETSDPPTHENDDFESYFDVEISYIVGIESRRWNKTKTKFRLHGSGWFWLGLMARS